MHFKLGPSTESSAPDLQLQEAKLYNIFVDVDGVDLSSDLQG